MRVGLGIQEGGSSIGRLGPDHRLWGCKDGGLSFHSDHSVLGYRCLVLIYRWLGPSLRTLGFKCRSLGPGHWCLVPSCESLESSCAVWNPHNMLLVSSPLLLALVCLLVAFELGLVPEALPTEGARVGPVTQMDAAVTTQSRSVTIGLVAERAAEGPLPQVHAPVVAEGLGVPE